MPNSKFYTCLNMAALAHGNQPEAFAADALDWLARFYASAMGKPSQEATYIFIAKVPEMQDQLIITSTVVPDDLGVVLEEAAQQVRDIPATRIDDHDDDLD